MAQKKSPAPLNFKHKCMETQTLQNPFEVLMSEIRLVRSELASLSSQIVSISDKEIFDTEQAAKIIGVHRNTLVQILRRGEIKAQRSGRKYIITREALDEFLAESKTTGRRPYRGH